MANWEHKKIVCDDGYEFWVSKYIPGVETQEQYDAWKADQEKKNEDYEVKEEVKNDKS